MVTQLTHSLTQVAYKSFAYNAKADRNSAITTLLPTRTFVVFGWSGVCLASASVSEPTCIKDEAHITVKKQ